VTPADRTISNLRWLDAVTVENVANGWLRNLETQFDELALDFAVSPARVFPGKSENEFLNFLTDRWSPTLGARAMLALCQHKEALKHLAFQYLPLEPPKKPDRRKGLALDRIDRSEFLQAHMPIFDGSDQSKPWVKELYRYVHWQ
jgi:hypothetical protein